MKVDVSVAEKQPVTAEEQKNLRKQRRVQERCFETPVNISKVSLPIIKQWLTDRLGEQLPDDDVAVEFIYELLIGGENDEPDIGAIREQMDDFLGKEKSRVFCLDLWQLLISAQSSPEGIPQKLVDERKKKIEEDEKARKEADVILRELRPNPSFSRARSQKPKASFKKTESKVTNVPPTMGNRVGKPSRKTNYNRS
ncbi:hypothetical protein JCM33374_g1037 [Metschnikowia sp. JCM 33374]|nr:hypothetical protein JCM33374_g1037 [Metschnikowia sp. JCM 33374]